MDAANDALDDITADATDSERDVLDELEDDTDVDLYLLAEAGDAEELAFYNNLGASGTADDALDGLAFDAPDEYLGSGSESGFDRSLQSDSRADAWRDKAGYGLNLGPDDSGSGSRTDVNLYLLGEAGDAEELACYEAGGGLDDFDMNEECSGLLQFFDDGSDMGLDSRGSTWSPSFHSSSESEVDMADGSPGNEHDMTDDYLDSVLSRDSHSDSCAGLNPSSFLDNNGSVSSSRGNGSIPDEDINSGLDADY